MSSSAGARPHQRLREQTINGRTGETADTHLTSSVSPFFVIRIGPPHLLERAWVVTVDKDLTTAILSPSLGSRIGK